MKGEFVPYCPEHFAERIIDTIPSPDVRASAAAEAVKILAVEFFRLPDETAIAIAESTRRLVGIGFSAASAVAAGRRSCAITAAALKVDPLDPPASPASF